MLHSRHLTPTLSALLGALFFCASAPALAQSAPSSLTLSGHASTKAPPTSNGAEGNWFYDVDSGNVWGPKTSGFWPTTPAYVGAGINSNVPGNDISFIGDSLVQVGCSSLPATFTGVGSFSTGGSGQCYPSWVNSLSRGALVWSPSAGYTGNYYGIQSVYVLTGGVCTPNQTVSFTPNTATVNASAVSFLVSSTGSISGNAKPNNPGAGYVALPTFTQTSGTACTTAPTFVAAVTGVGTFGVLGDSTLGTIARAPDWTAVHHSFCVIVIGTNDVAAGTLYPALEANYATIIALAKPACTVIGLESIPPRTALTTAQEQVRLKVNDWLKLQANISQASAPPAQLVYIDVAQYWTDATSATGQPLANYTADGLHENVTGAFYMALATINSFRPYFHSAYAENQAQTDIYNATSNPSGNIIGTPGLFLGTGGTASAPASGTVATGWTLSRAAGAGTCTAAGSLETRTDLPSGQRQLVTISCASGTATQEQIQMNLSANISSNISPGDSVYAHVEIDISNAANLSSVKANLVENNTISQSAPCTGDFNSTNLLPASTAIATMIGGDALPNFGKTASGSFTYICDTPRITLQPGSPSLNFYLDIVGTDASATFTTNARFANASIRKYNVP